MNPARGTSSSSPAESPPTRDGAGETDSTPSTLLNGLIGGFVSVYVEVEV